MARPAAGGGQSLADERFDGRDVQRRRDLLAGAFGVDSEVRNGYDDIKVTFKIDADASKKEIEAIVAQSQKRSEVYDVITNPVNVTVEVV